MTPEEIISLSDLNTAESRRQFARFHPDSRIVEQDDLLMIAAADDFPVGFANAVFQLGGPPDPEKLIAAGDARFGPMGRGYTVWTRGHLDSGVEHAYEAAGRTQRLHSVLGRSFCRRANRESPSISAWATAK